MKICYILSKFPEISETFIAREMHQMRCNKNEITAYRFRKSKSVSTMGEENSQIAVIYTVFEHPSNILISFFWGIRFHSNCVYSFLEEIFNSKKNISNKLKLFAIMLSAIVIARSISGKRIEHIRANFLHSEAVCARWVSELTKIPYSLTIHTRAIVFPIEMIKKCILDASFCTCISVDTQRFYQELSNHSLNCHLLRNGIDLMDFPFNYVPIASTLRLLAVGRLIKKKGFDDLIRACNLLKEKKVAFYCEIIGEGPERNDLQNLIDGFELNKNVRLIGSEPFSCVKEKMNMANILIMPSKIIPDSNDYDGIPTVIIEAMGLGVPVISTDVAGIPELVINNITGFQISQGDYYGIFEKILAIYSNQKIVLNLVRNARLEIENNYDLKANCLKLQSLVENNSYRGKYES